MYRLKVCYRGNWKLARVIHPTIEAAEDSQKKLASMGVESRVCDFAGKEIYRRRKTVK